MLKGTQMRDALVAAGYEAPAPKRQRNGRKFKCKTCGATMVSPEWFVNGMFCPECSKKPSYFLFTNGRA